MIFHVKDVDGLWGYLKATEFNAAEPRDAAWGERYFHLHDPDGHELSFAKPLRGIKVAVRGLAPEALSISHCSDVAARPPGGSLRALSKIPQRYQQ